MTEQTTDLAGRVAMLEARLEWLEKLPEPQKFRHQEAEERRKRDEAEEAAREEAWQLQQIREALRMEHVFVDTTYGDVPWKGTLCSDGTLIKDSPLNGNPARVVQRPPDEVTRLVGRWLFACNTLHQAVQREAPEEEIRPLKERLAAVDAECAEFRRRKDEERRQERERQWQRQMEQAARDQEARRQELLRQAKALEPAGTPPAV
jgi:hypothetical protein